ncbi:Ig-like domain-containing protein [Tepidibacillus fermentans]|uniref:Bacterial Ig domain-containing protein n=1 Tax=Tepidibacillus fermentans TaxID=1281767 RepID=A0A4R3KLM3_9BACI|nr:Ig-like domain-containing protein [Tepidibacillus fermentans]TCS84490.1 hypothetical protein EDD72_101154 [Tepidibacillus fermentans]
MFKYLNLLFIILMLFVMSFQVDIIAQASTGTNVSGIIKQDTTWTLAGSPYYLTGDIQIANGVTLTVESGVIIEGNNNRIRVFGDFEAIGKSNSRIVFNDVNIEPGENTPSEQYLIHIENADIIKGSLYRPTGNAIYGSLILRDSRLFDLESYLYLWYPTSDVYIERNAFVNTGGISVGTSDNVKVHILNNAFFNYSNFAVENWASYGTSETIVLFNSFLNSKEDDLGNPITYKDTLVLPAGYSSAKMTATNNYWGTIDETVIEKMIFDKNDDISSASYINFKPYLQSPDPNTPIIDIVPPEKPMVDDITEKSEYITGKAEELSVINVVNENNDIVGKTITDANGDFRINIMPLNAGSKLFITATDDWLNKSEPTIVFVKDITPPNKPLTDEVTDKTTSVTGTAEAGSSITVKAGTSVLGTGTVDINGKYIVTIPEQKAGTKLTITATDNAGNTSEANEVTIKDVTAPSIPSVNAVYDNATVITGKAEANAKVFAMIGSKKIGEVTAKNGQYTIKIAKQKAGTTILVYAVDTAGNISASKTIVVIDKTPPSVPIVNKITSKSVTVSGKGEKGATIYIYNGNKKIGQGIVDNRGNFKVKIKKQKKGSRLKIYAKDKSGNNSKSITIKVN